jgi:lipopolysaccharide/colanic/teichoic acid biosynthesis glycosyltransferase
LLAKRLFDVVASSVGLVVLLPLLLVIALAIRLESPGPAFFRQERVGRFGKVFRVHKFRSMVADAERRGMQITSGADPRITVVGALLRKYKLDELPQLIDVLAGHMSLVGPRPEVPRYVNCYPKEVRDIVLSVRPGITDWASIEYRNENAVLGEAVDPHRAYVEEVLPVKLRYYVDYVENRSFWGDIRIILATLLAIGR